MTDERPDGEPAVGSVGEEAVKLLGALQDWAREAGVGSASAAATGLGARLSEVNEHIATGGRDCTYCPVCQVIGLLRQTNPEVRTHLAVAASSLLQAVAGLMETSVPSEQSRREGVQKIDLDDDRGWDAD